MQKIPLYYITFMYKN